MGDNEVMKTSQALFFYPADSIHNETLDRLADLETMTLNDGTVSFNIKGFARKNEETILLVEGGTLIFDINGLINVTGEEPTLLLLPENSDRRELSFGLYWGTKGWSGGFRGLFD